MMDVHLLKRLLRYDPETGIFWNVVRRGNWALEGAQTKVNFDKDGYATINLCGARYRAGRLAFLFMTGRWPVHEIDHIDGDRANDAWHNLREATRSENVANSDRPVGASGLRGVKWDSIASIWRARVAFRGRREYVGAYATAEEAHEAYLAAASATHGEFALHNRPQPLGVA